MPTNRIDSLKIRDLRPVTDPIDLNLDPRCNILIGPNGCGKSTLLRAIASALQDPDRWSDAALKHPSVEIDLRHETREIGGVEFYVPDAFDDMERDEFGFHRYHDSLCERAHSDYEYLCTGHWKSDVERAGELPTHLRIPFVYIPATRLPFPRKDDIVSAYVLGEDVVADGVFDGRRAFRDMERFDNPDPAADMATMSEEEISVYYRAHVLRSDTVEDEREVDVLWPALSDAAVARRQALLETTVTCAARICSDVLKPEVLSEHTHSTESGLRAERGVSEVTYAHWLPHTYDDSEDPITIGELSAGTQGPLMWIWHLVTELHDFFVSIHRHRLSHHRFERIGQVIYFVDDDGRGDEFLTPEQYAQLDNPAGYARRVFRGPTDDVLSWDEYRDREAPDDYRALPIPLPDEAPDEWRRMPFILLIDEIENHLHPTWQRRVIPALLDTFPNMQLIATTHSPFVVVGREEGQVHRLHRDHDRIVRAETNTQDIVGWTVEDILRAFMEVPDPTDEATAVAAVVLRWLRKLDPRDGITAEEWRQELMSQLSDEGAQSSLETLVALGWLQRLSTLTGSAHDWWQEQIDEMEERVSPVVEYQGQVNADRERYVAELEEILWQLEERLGEDLF